MTKSSRKECSNRSVTLHQIYSICKVVLHQQNISIFQILFAQRPIEQHAAYVNSFLIGHPNYDIGINQL